MEKNMHVLCFHVNFKHESTKLACFHAFSAFFTPPPPQNGKRSIWSLYSPVGVYMYLQGLVMHNCLCVHMCTYVRV